MWKEEDVVPALYTRRKKCSPLNGMKRSRQIPTPPRRSDGVLPSRPTVRAFTLLELLLVMAIVAILALLLLPVISKAKGRGKQIECLSQLRQVGVAAHSFAHEHGDRFPFQMPVKEGGTLELVQAAVAVGGNVQFAFRHFQALSNDLSDPKLLVCPADTRVQAASFPALLNDHISFFIATTAEYSQPDSLLSGDRNIVAAGGSSGSILRISSGTEVAWTADGHEYKGNLLLADGHVERTTKMGLQAAMGNSPGPVSAWAPVASPSAGASTPSTGKQGSVAGAGGAGGGSGGNSGGNNGGSSASGFAALQSFFQSPQNSGGSAPTPPPPTPSVRAAAPVPPPANVAQQPPPVEASAPAKKPATNQLAAAVAPTPASPLSGSAPELDGTQPVPGVFIIFIEPERCWTCWLVFLVLSLATATTLGVFVQRRHQRRAQQAGTIGGAAVPPA
jgi:prepilin-type N-terminal cleavage/methylation domain-containing protein/prepilin-type processing-associated H-X9-DG protein